MGCGGEPPVCDLKVSECVEREVCVCVWGCLLVKNGGERICVHASVGAYVRICGLMFLRFLSTKPDLWCLSSSLPPVGHE